MTTVADAPEGTATLQMVRADVNVRDFQRWMGTRRLQDPDHRHALSPDRNLRGTGARSPSG